MFPRRHSCLLTCPTVRQRNLKKLRAKNYDGSDDEWTTIVSHVFGPKTKSSIDAAQKANLVVTGSIAGEDPNATLSITFNNRVEDITQRLGTVELPQTEDTDGVNLFEWTLQAIEKRDELEDSVASLREQTTSKDELLASLHKQFDEVVEAKVEYEAQLLSKFSILLNEKKLKIRNMQRILSATKVDEKKLKELKTDIEDEPINRDGQRKKRQAGTAPNEDETDEDDDFETMAVDGGANADDNPNDAQSAESAEATPEPSDSDDEDDDLDASAPGPDRPRTRAMDSQRASKQKSPSPLPPRRDLPFQKKTSGQGHKASKEPPPAADEDDEETASEASEL